MKKIQCQSLVNLTLGNPLVNRVNSLLSNKIFTYYFSSDSLEFLNDRIVCVECTSLNLAICFSRKNNNMVILPAEQYEVKISLSLSAMLQLLNEQVDADTLFFNRKLMIDGDTALGLQCKNLLDMAERSKTPKLLAHLLLQLGQRVSLVK